MLFVDIVSLCPFSNFIIRVARCDPFYSFATSTFKHSLRRKMESVTFSSTPTCGGIHHSYHSHHQSLSLKQPPKLKFLSELQTADNESFPLPFPPSLLNAGTRGTRSCVRASCVRSHQSIKKQSILRATCVLPAFCKCKCKPATAFASLRHCLVLLLRLPSPYDQYINLINSINFPFSSFSRERHLRLCTGLD